MRWESFVRPTWRGVKRVGGVVDIVSGSEVDWGRKSRYCVRLVTCGKQTDTGESMAEAAHLNMKNEIVAHRNGFLSRCSEEEGWWGEK